MNQVFEYFERKKVKTLLMSHNSFLFLENKEQNFLMVCSTTFQGKNSSTCDHCGTPESESSIILEFSYYKPTIHLEILHTHMNLNEDVIDVILRSNILPDIKSLTPVVLSKHEINNYLCKAIFRSSNLLKLVAKEELNRFIFVAFIV